MEELIAMLLAETSPTQNIRRVFYEFSILIVSTGVVEIAGYFVSGFDSQLLSHELIFTGESY